MATDVGQCKLCLQYYRMDAAGRLPEHDATATRKPCRGRWPRQGKPEDYPEGYPSEPPWILRGGLVERDRRKF